MNTQIIPYEDRVMQVSAQNGYGCRLMGYGPRLTQTVYIEGWMLEPVTNKTRLPSDAWDRIRAFQKAGCVVDSAMIAHELPHALPGPVQRSREQGLWPTGEEIVTISEKIVTGLGMATVAAAKATGRAALGVGRVAAEGAGAMITGLLEAPIYLDPVICIRLDSGLYVEIMRWKDY